MKFLMWVGTILVLMFSCKTEPEEQPDLEVMPDTDTMYLEVRVDNLRMRAEPDLTSNTILMLAEGSKVQYWDEHSESKIQVTLRGQAVSDYWYRVRYGRDEGWVFGGALQKVEKKEAFDLLILPGQRVGPIQVEDNEQSIIDRLGGEVVERGEFSVGEGESVTVTYVFPSTEKELILFWDQEDFNRLREIRIRKKGSPWKLTSGIGIGSTLKEVEKANEGPFMLSGFEWDYAGTTLNWQGGSLSDQISMVFDPPAKIHKSLIGDHSIASDDDRMSRANPAVAVIRVLF